MGSSGTNRWIRLRFAAMILIAWFFSLCLAPCAQAADDQTDEEAVESTAVAIDNKTDVADGTYVPASYAWSGGSGRLKGIECPSIEVRNGESMATIVFGSGNYEALRIGDVQVSNQTSGSDVSTFVLPMPLDQVVVVEGLTTAMSQPHWIAYNLYCTLDEPENDALQAQAILARYEAVSAQTTKRLRAQTAGARLIVETLLGASGEQTGGEEYVPAEFSLDGVEVEQDASAPAVTGLTYQASLSLTSATGFAVHYYEGGYKLLDLGASGQFLVVPEGAKAPDGLNKDIAVLYQPIDRIYLCATAGMSLIDAIDALGAVTLTGTDVSGWEIEAPRAALKAGTMRFAGRYSAPDFEMLVANSCDIAIESTMILHNPEVKEMIEQLGVPVLIELSSSEAEPLGRLEWVKLYGALLNREKAAQDFFNEKMQVVNEVASNEPTGKTVAFFAVKSDGSVTIRRPGDYMARCIELAGGTYAFADLQAPGSGNTVNITMEQFYSVASKVDYLVYNGTIQQPINTIDDLLAMSETFADYKAVKDGNVYSTARDLYQSTDRIAEVILDFHTLVTDGGSEMTFLYKVG